MNKICKSLGLVELKRATTLFFCKMSDKILNIKPETWCVQANFRSREKRNTVTDIVQHLHSIKLNSCAPFFRRILLNGSLLSQLKYNCCSFQNAFCKNCEINKQTIQALKVKELKLSLVFSFNMSVFVGHNRPMFSPLLFMFIQVFMSQQKISGDFRHSFSLINCFQRKSMPQGRPTPRVTAERWSY